ncbi:hypothetical protein C498_09691 [Haloferax volcanii DS2]|uniref:Uncharacterized protein n=1 Tax=Haloferax volcanii (strain ATCC 29605 / DSM 3757 / JCM 8879 / NBRC 14742 / NCIMB 2012 / VKM B-1768 / DS2) TaxID=309800 RepID=L9V4V1_HALVD|nr:hypothetical protein C498_09691 [Haloferax volcanii DS2]
MAVSNAGEPNGSPASSGLCAGRTLGVRSFDARRPKKNTGKNAYNAA